MVKEYVDGKYHIIKRNDGWNIEVDDGWCYHQAITKLWWPIEPFDSFIKAVKYLKENKEDLI